MICPPTLVTHKRPPTNDLETPSFNRFPVRTVTEEDIAQPELVTDSTEGCFSCGEWTHTTEQCQALDELFPFLLIGWVAERNENAFILAPIKPPDPSDGKRREGFVARISNVYRPRLPMIRKDITKLAVPYYRGTARLEEPADT